LLRKKPSTIRPEPKVLSTVVVIETALPNLSTMTKWVVPPGSAVRSGARTPAPLGLPGAGACGLAVGPISLARSAM
jgi:hypothetical protein